MPRLFALLLAALLTIGSAMMHKTTSEGDKTPTESPRHVSIAPK
ncbi:hypothetical protein [Hydrogenimonas sp.]